LKEKSRGGKKERKMRGVLYIERGRASEKDK
jgi:hypothetical protein